MKIGQLIKYNMRNTFLEKSYIECCGETIPRPFKKSKFRKFLDQQSKVLYSLFFFVCQVEDYRSETKLQTTCFYLI